MGLLNKAKEALESFASGDSNRNEYDANGSGGAREKVIEFAQKKVAERELEKNDPGYVDKHKSIVKKAVDAAEDFIAKQGEPQRSNPSSSMNSSSYGTDGYSSRYPADSQNDSDYVREDYSAEKLSYSSRIESDQDGISDSFQTMSLERNAISTNPGENPISYNSRKLKEAADDANRYSSDPQSYQNNSRQDDSTVTSSYSTRVDNDSYNSYGNTRLGSDDTPSSAFSGSSAYRSFRTRDDDKEETNEYSTSTSRFVGTSRNDSDNSRQDDSTVTSSYSTRVDNDSYNSYGNTRLGSDDTPSSAFSGSSAYRSSRTRDDDEEETNEYSTSTSRYVGTSRNDSDNSRQDDSTVTSSYSTRVDNDSYNSYGNTRLGSNVSTDSYERSKNFLQGSGDNNDERSYSTYSNAAAGSGFGGVGAQRGANNNQDNSYRSDRLNIKDNRRYGGY